jgi:hypothetical protein
MGRSDVRIDWKRLSLDVGRVRVRLKTMLATLLVGAISAMQSLEFVDLTPVVSMFVSSENRAAFYVTVITVLMAVLRGVTNGPLWEVAPQFDETEHGVDDGSRS